MPFHPPLIARTAAAFVALCSASAGPAQAAGQAGDFDFYVLALTWSPTYCATDEYPDPAQCGLDPPGFLVHGLWPQYEVGYPEYCPSSYPRGIDSDTLDAISAVMPSASLARYQWRKHGMCSGLDARAYFDLLLEAAASITFPKPLLAPRTDQTAPPSAIEAAFVAANPGLTRDAMSIQCRRGELTEVRICFTKDLEFRPCLEVDDDTCRSSTITVPAGR